MKLKCVSFKNTLVFLLFLWIFNYAVYAAPKEHFDQASFLQSLAQMGITYSQSNKNLNIMINQEKALSEIPAMQKMEILNPDVSQTEINLQPTVLSNSIGMFFTTAILPTIYESALVDDLNVKGYLLLPDDYGNPIKQLCFSFDFNRNLYKKINWKNLNSGNMFKIVPHFRISEWCRSKINTELAQ